MKRGMAGSFLLERLGRLEASVVGERGVRGERFPPRSGGVDLDRLSLLAGETDAVGRAGAGAGPERRDPTRGRDDAGVSPVACRPAVAVPVGGVDLDLQAVVACCGGGP